MNNESYAFCALLARMKYINRWGLMRCARTESLCEHTADTSITAHILCLIATNILGQSGIDAQKVGIAALYHDASEIITGDMPTPVKYKNDEIKNAYKALEEESAENLAQLLPAELQGALKPMLTGKALNTEEKKLLKAADKLSALAKCIEEESTGNTEFKSAKKQQIKMLKEMDCPAADYYVKHFLPAFNATLDELTAP